METTLRERRPATSSGEGEDVVLKAEDEKPPLDLDSNDGLIYPLRSNCFAQFALRALALGAIITGAAVTLLPSAGMAVGTSAAVLSAVAARSHLSKKRKEKGD